MKNTGNIEMTIQCLFDNDRQSTLTLAHSQSLRSISINLIIIFRFHFESCVVTGRHSFSLFAFELMSANIAHGRSFPILFFLFFFFFIGTRTTEIQLFCCGNDDSPRHHCTIFRNQMRIDR